MSFFVVNHEKDSISWSRSDAVFATETSDSA
jgi:hypothetical protein